MESIGVPNGKSRHRRDFPVIGDLIVSHALNSVFDRKSDHVGAPESPTFMASSCVMPEWRSVRTKGA
jgi:hypothetical protein